MLVRVHGWAFRHAAAIPVRREAGPSQTALDAMGSEYFRGRSDEQGNAVVVDEGALKDGDGFTLLPNRGDCRVRVR